MTDIKKPEQKYNFLKSLGDGRYYDVEKIFENKKDKNIKYRIGVDSLNIKDKSIYIISLVGIYEGKQGAFVLYQKQRHPKIINIQERLWKEVEIAIEASIYFRDVHELDIETIEFDLNIDSYYPSSKLYLSALNYAESNGFRGIAKPGLLAAISASDFVVHKGRFNKIRNTKYKRTTK